MKLTYGASCTIPDSEVEAATLIVASAPDGATTLDLIRLLRETYGWTLLQARAFLDYSKAV